MDEVPVPSAHPPKHDPYTRGAGETRAAPTSFRGRLRYLGPSLVISGSIVGSGELLLTSGLGATVGFVLLWWVLVACWSKTVLQSELTRYIICSGDTYLRALNRVPGKIPGPRGPLSWAICMAMLAFIPSVTGLGGIVGGAGQALSLLFPVINSTVGTAIAAILAMIILGSGAYRRLEKAMLILVVGFTATTLVCAVLMQFTEFRMTSSDLAAGFAFDFPIQFGVLALAMYGYTGVNATEISAYTYWCVEKGYPRFIGGDHEDPGWTERARGWIKVLHTDILVTLLILTCATVPFYTLGAGVLHPAGERPEGLETISVLSGMFTQTLGGWSLWLFGIGAFFILFSTTLSGIGAGARYIPEYAIELGFIDRLLVRRHIWIRVYVLVVPVISFLLYLSFKRPVLLVTIGAVTAALLLPMQSGVTLWLQRNRMDPRVRPSKPMYVALVFTFLFQLAMAVLLVWFTIL